MIVQRLSNESGPARGFGYTVSRAILIQAYGIFWPEFGYKVFSFSWILGIRYMVQKSLIHFIIALMLTKNSADARNCYCLASYPSKPTPTPTTSWIAISYPGHTGLFVHHYACLPKVKVCALCQSHVLFIEVKKWNHAISSLPSWKLGWRKH